jgi:hypothetical protein
VAQIGTRRHVALTVKGAAVVAAVEIRNPDEVVSTLDTEHGQEDTGKEGYLGV